LILVIFWKTSLDDQWGFLFEHRNPMIHQL